jgi:hypothetical protein
VRSSERRSEFLDGGLPRRRRGLGGAIFQRAGKQPMRRRPRAPFRSERGEPGKRETVERLVPRPAGIDDDLSYQGVEIDFPEGGDASDVAGVARARSPAALATEGKASMRSPTEKGRARKSS